MELFTFIILIFVIWKTSKKSGMSPKDKIEKEYRGTVFQRVSVKSNKTDYEICFNMGCCSPFWNFYKFSYSRERFEELITCLDSGIKTEIASSSGRSIKIVSPHPTGETLLSLSSSASWQQQPLERKIINQMVADFEQGII